MVAEQFGVMAIGSEDRYFILQLDTHNHMLDIGGLEVLHEPPKSLNLAVDHGRRIV